MASEYKKGVIHAAIRVPFNKAKFFEMVREILKNVPDDKRDRFDRRGAYIYNDFSPYVTRFQRIGKYMSPDKKRIDILVVHLKKETSLERARTMQRNFVAKYLKDDKGSGIKHAALVAFVAPDKEDWRLSLVKVEYKLNEQGNVEEKLSPARRHSFLIEENSPTAEGRIRLMPEAPTLGELEEIFSVEKVTKEFFDKYSDLFLRLRKQLDKVIASDAAVESHFVDKGIDPADFAKKLLGQIVFLYFLQKKGWFGVPRDREWGDGSKNFLRELFKKKHGDYQSFFNDILEPLFYNTLAVERPWDWSDRFNCRIPFLNGGLFDPINGYDWINVDILLPDTIFFNTNKIKGGDTGDGILNIFDRYNFTVNENEPFEKEVAVDPEMLGKVFEKLRPVKDRRSQSTFYTPREIVHYMCRESLANYLTTELEGSVEGDDIEELLKYGEDVAENESRVVREGRETETYESKLPKNVRRHAELIDAKLATIRVCDPAVGSGAFPVGMMNEIVRVRNALSPYVGTRNERPLYDFKRQAIENNLYGVDSDLGAVEIAKLRLWLSLIVDENDRGTIKPLPNLDYKVMQGNSLLGIEKDIFTAEQIEKIEELKTIHRKEVNFAKKQKYDEQIKKLINEVTEGRKEFNFRLYFSEVFREKQGFDVVIANPPYKSAQRMDKEDPGDRDAIKKRLSQYSFLVRHWDIYIAFVAKGDQILRERGNLAYIVPNPILKELYALELRKYLLEKMTLKNILAFNDVNVFEKVSRRTTVFTALKAKPNRTYKIPVFGNDEDTVKLTNEVNSDDWLNEPRHIFSIGGDSTKTELLNKIDGKSSKIANHFYVNYGAQVSSKVSGLFGKEDVVTEEPGGNAKPFFEGRDVHRWKMSYRPLWLDYRKSEMYGSRAPELFEAEKLVIRKISDKKHRLAVALDRTGFYTDDGNVLVVPYSAIEGSGLRINSKKFNISQSKLSLKYALAVLLSSLESFYFKERFATESLQGKTSHTYPVSVKNLPIIELSPDEQKPFIDIVDKILAITGTDDYQQCPTKQAQVCAYEKDIDKLVYQLYDLTPEEIEIVKANNPTHGGTK